MIKILLEVRTVRRRQTEIGGETNFVGASSPTTASSFRLLCFTTKVALTYVSRPPCLFEGGSSTCICTHLFIG